MSAHENCRAVGKFDCWADQRISEMVQEGFFDTDGDVESPAGWFAAVDLDVECEGHEHDPSRPDSVAGMETYCDGSCRPDYRLAQHYGTPWLIARENSQGFFWVATHATEEKRDEHVANLERVHELWASGDDEPTPLLRNTSPTRRRIRNALLAEAPELAAAYVAEINRLDVVEVMLDELVKLHHEGASFEIDDVGVNEDGKAVTIFGTVTMSSRAPYIIGEVS